MGRRTADLRKTVGLMMRVAVNVVPKVKVKKKNVREFVCNRRC